MRVCAFVLWVMLKEAERRLLIAEDRETMGAEKKVIEAADAEYLLSDAYTLSLMSR